MNNAKVLDTECYKDYWLLSLKCVRTNKVREFELYEGHPLDRQSITKIMNNNLTVSFNGNGYDLAMITAALKGWSNENLKKLSDKIILSGKAIWTVCREHKLFIPKEWDHIDLIQVAPGAASLKIYGGRLHSKKLQDLPIDPDESITPELRPLMRSYCINDLDTTIDLFKALEKPLKLRVEMSELYGIDLRSKSDAQIAEAVLNSELRNIGVDVGKNPIDEGTVFKYKPPSFIKFKSDKLKEMFCTVIDAEFVVQESGQVKLPKTLNKAIDFDGAKYKFGIGGLHSQEKSQVVECGDDDFLYEADFASYYPFIILGEQFYPEHLGEGFLKVYNDIVQKRIEAKRTGDKSTADSLKISINGSFGKLGSKYSTLYSPNLLIQTTVTGQLCLFMLIEAVTALGAKVVSANTDGIVIHCNKSIYSDVGQALFNFELISGYTLEETFYKAIYSRDVNSYCAIKTDKSIKGKGAYASGGLMKNPNNNICISAVKSYLVSGVNIEHTIMSCSDITQFVAVRQVTGGAIYDGENLGKAVRFYHSLRGKGLTYKKKGNKVPTSDGCKPLMNLPDTLPNDIDYGWYIKESLELLSKLGYNEGVH